MTATASACVKDSPFFSVITSESMVSLFRTKAVPQGLRQLDRRLLFGYSASQKLFRPASAVQNSGAVPTGVDVLQYFLPGFDRQFVVQICIEIPPIFLAGSFVEVNHVHIHLPVASCRRHSRRRSVPVSSVAAFCLGSSGTSPFPPGYQASPRFPCKRIPGRLPAEPLHESLLELRPGP